MICWIRFWVSSPPFFLSDVCSQHPSPSLILMREMFCRKPRWSGSEEGVDRDRVGEGMASLHGAAILDEARHTSMSSRMKANLSRSFCRQSRRKQGGNEVD